MPAISIENVIQRRIGMLKDYPTGPYAKQQMNKNAYTLPFWGNSCAKSVLILGLLLLCRGFQVFELEAQYPSASYRTTTTPMLSEFNSYNPPSYNPAFLGFGRDRLREDLSRRVHLRVLDMMASYTVLSNLFLTDPPNFEDAVSDRVSELVLGLSVNFTDLSSRNQIYRDALTAYTRDLLIKVVPPLSATARANMPAGLNRAQIEQAQEYNNYKNRLEGDATTFLNNIGKVLGDIGIDYLKDQPLFRSELYLQVFDIEVLLAQQVSLGFGVNVRSHIDVEDDLSGFTMDATRLNLPQMNLDGIPLPTDADWQNNLSAASAGLGVGLGLATANYITNLARSLNAKKLGKLVLQSLFEQSFISLYNVIEPNLRFSFGFPITNWLYMGHRIQGQLIWGLNNQMIPPDVLDIGNPKELSGYIFNPVNYQLSMHAGWDVSFLLQPLDWFSFSLMVTDVLGIAPSKKNSSSDYWGDFYYPIDLQLGIFFRIPIASDFHIGFGTDVYSFISLLTGRAQRFDKSPKMGFLNHFFRVKFYFDYMNQFRIVLGYLHEALGMTLEFNFLTFHPSIGVEIALDFQDIRIRLDIMHFTN